MLVLFLATIVPWPPSDWLTRLVIYGGTLVVAFAIAEVTERRKDAWRRGFMRLGTLPRPASRAVAP